MYSTIKKKYCKEEGCGRLPQIGLNGWCFTHAPEEIKSKYKSKKDYHVKKNNAAKYASTKLRMANYAGNTEQEMWFKRIALEIENKPYCWECNQYIPKKFYRAATAHIFPKSLFPSIATHPLNFLVLAAGCCHDKTHRIDTFSKMKVFPIAIERFYQFEKEIKENHKYLDLFKEAIKNYHENNS